MNKFCYFVQLLKKKNTTNTNTIYTSNVYYYFGKAVSIRIANTFLKLIIQRLFFSIKNRFIYMHILL